MRASAAPAAPARVSVRGRCVGGRSARQQRRRPPGSAAV